MKTLYPLTLILVAGFFTSSFNNLEKNDVNTKKTSADIYMNTIYKNDDVVDTEVLNDFFRRYSDLKKYQNDVISLYKNRSYGTIWYKDGKITDFGNILFKKINNTDQKSAQIEFPYKEEISLIFSTDSKEKLSKTDSDMLLSAAYIIYANQALEGKQQTISYETLLDSLMSKPALLDKDPKNGSVVNNIYSKLEDALKKYKKIEKDDNWKPISVETPYKDIRPDAKSNTVAQIRNRLFVMGDLKNDSKSDVYDQELMDGVMKYKLRNGLKPNYIINEDNIKDLNTPIDEKIKTLTLNIERCKAIMPQLGDNKEYIMVNVPSFELIYVKNGKIELTSKVFVGAPLTKTTIFNSNIDKIVFSPYWTVPQSIVDNELKSKIAADKNYLEEHNMEIVNGQVRQKPGPENSLGLVKFIFPNPDDIYMHDTPAKTLFDFEKRTFSHGCVNVNKAKELAIAMLKDYPEWTEERINKAMDGTEETTFKLANKVPIYICYFTSWVNESGEVSFFQDVYERDSDLSKILLNENTVANK